MDKDEVIANLKAIDWRGLGARLVLVHGSLLHGRGFRDIDLVVFVDRDTDADDAALDIMEAVERATGFEADVYVVNDISNVNCFLLLEAVRKGVILYQEAIGRDMLVKSIGICVDFMISRRKLKYTETLVRGILRNAP